MSHAAISATARKPLIWITDDSPLEARYTERALGPAYAYEHFSDGSSVVERLAQSSRQPDVLLLDWMMPEMTGDEVCRFLRSNPSTADLPIMIVTASRIETADVVAGLAVGANDYVARPFVAEELRARVETLLRTKRMRELATRERLRLSAVGRLARALIGIEPSTTRVVQALASSLVESLCDGCAIALLPGATPGVTVVRHRTRQGEELLSKLAAVGDPCDHVFASDDQARAALPAVYHPLIDHHGISALSVIPFPPRSPVIGVVTVTRDGHSEPFERADLDTIATCIEYAAMALENALRFDAERTARQQLQTILEQLPIAILAVEPGGALTHVNQSALDLMPTSRHSRTLDDVRDRIVMRAPDGSPIPDEERPLTLALKGQGVRGFEAELQREDGSTRYIRASAVPLRDIRGAVSAAVLALDDISAEHAATTEREQAAKFQQYVLGIVSHDMRTPLQTMLMGSEHIRMIAGADDKLNKVVDRMVAATNRMSGIVEQLLDVTRARLGGGIPYLPAEAYLDQIATRVLDELALAYPSVKFEAALVPIRGMWDADRLAQVVQNLVSNAIQHGAKGEPIGLVAREDGAMAQLRITNRTAGKPLSPEQIATIFTPFRRAAAARGGSGGLGLGLYIASEIVRAHRGDIAVESDSAHTTFTIRIPLDPRSRGA